MADIDVALGEVREFRRDLRKLGQREVDKELRDAIREAATQVKIEAQLAAPVRSGALAKSLKASVTATRASIYSLLPYAPVVHWGGTIMPRGIPIAFPRTEFISRAVERNADEFVERLGDGVDRAAKRTGWT